MPGWVNVFLGVLTVVTAAGAGVAVVSARELRARVADLRGEVDDKDKKIVRIGADLLAEQAERKMLQTEVAALRRVVTGEEKLDEIRAQNIKHHAAAVEHWQAQERLLGRILVAFERERGKG